MYISLDLGKNPRETKPTYLFELGIVILNFCKLQHKLLKLLIMYIVIKFQGFFF